MGTHLIDGEFQSDKYPTTPRGKVPLSVRDETAQDLLWEYARRRRGVDAEFSDDLEAALRLAGSRDPSPAGPARKVMTPEEIDAVVDRLSTRGGSFADRLRAFSRQVLVDLFARHCACRPIDTSRVSHSHDCDARYVNPIRTILHRIVVEGGIVRAASDAECIWARSECESLICPGDHDLGSGARSTRSSLPSPSHVVLNAGDPSGDSLDDFAGRVYDRLSRDVPEIEFDPDAASDDRRSSSEYVDGYTDARSGAIAALESLGGELKTRHEIACAAAEERARDAERRLSEAHVLLDTIGRAAGLIVFPDGGDLDRDVAASVAASVASICAFASRGRTTDISAIAASLELELEMESARRTRGAARDLGQLTKREVVRRLSGKDASERTDRQVDDVGRHPAVRVLLKVASSRPKSLTLDRVSEIAGSSDLARSLVSDMVADDVLGFVTDSGPKRVALTALGLRVVALVRGRSKDHAKREHVDREVCRLLRASIRPRDPQDPDPGKIGHRLKKASGKRRAS